MSAKHGTIRPFTERDFEPVADMHRRVFNTGDRLSPPLLQRYQAYFREVYFQNPWMDSRISSLVFETPEGQVAGFIGAVPRRMLAFGRPITAAVGTQFVVDPSQRSALAGLQLLKAFLDGPQDLSIADEANEDSRRIWEGLRGTTALLYSVHWTRPLRPTQLAVSFASRNRGAGSWAALAKPVTKLADSLAARVRHSQFHLDPPDLSAEDAEPAALVECINQHALKAALRPAYDATSLEWLLRRASGMATFGDLRKVILRDAKGKIVGWYVYFVKPGGIAEVLHLGATRQTASPVLAHVSYDAWRRGVLALTGRLEPEFLRPLSDAYCLLQRGRYWVLINSTRPEILDALHRGDAHFSRLEGEFALRFGGASWTQ
jgi:hypothetical protein